MEERKKTIKNVTPQDLEKLIESVEATPVNIDTPNNYTSNINLKPKKSKHEPDPVRFKLPSGSLFIEEGYIYIRRLNTTEESILLEMNGEKELTEGINKIFETAIKSDINVLNIPLIDKILIFSAIIAITYGKELDIKDLVSQKCTNCKENTFVGFDVINDLKINPVPDDFNFPMSILTEDKKYYLKFRYPTIRDESLSEKNSLMFIKNIILEIKNLENNTLLEKEEYSDVIEWLSSVDKKQITNKLKDFSKYGNDFKVNVSKCSNSQCTMKDSKVDMTSEDLMIRIISSVVNNLST